MRRLWIVVLSVVGAGVCLTIGFWLGVREGAQLGLMIDFAPRGSIAVINIQAIEAGKTKNTLTFLESEVDNALLWNSKLEAEPLYPLLGPVWGLPTAELPKYLGRVADYRKDHLSPLRPEALAQQPEPSDEQQREFRAWLLEGARENQEIIARMVARYSTKSEAAP